MLRKATIWTFQTINKRYLSLENLDITKTNLKRETESLSTAGQNNAIRTNYVKTKIDKTLQNSKCWLCGEIDETINHISECSKKEYNTRYDRLVR